MKVLVYTVATEEEKDQWLARIPDSGPDGKTGHYEAEGPGSSGKWKIYFVPA